MLVRDHLIDAGAAESGGFPCNGGPEESVPIATPMPTLTKLTRKHYKAHLVTATVSSMP